MKKFLNNLKAEASNIRMSAAEKSAMRAALFGAASPVQTAPSPYFFFSYQFRMVMAGFLVFVLAGAGTVSAAAGGALPGDLLYPVKINVNESVKIALASTPASRAQVHAELADARVEEAQALAAQGRLDTAATAKLSDNFDEHAKHAQDLVQSIAESDPGSAVEITTELDSALAANGAVLRSLGDKSTDKETKNNSGRFAVRVLAHVGATGRIALADSTSKAKRGAEAQPAAFSAATQSETSATLTAPAPGEERRSENSGEGNAAASIEIKAAQVLAGARAQFMQASSTLDATTTAQLSAQFGAIDMLMAQGSVSLGAGDSKAAMRSFTEALSKSAQLRAVLKAQIKYDGDILKPLLQFDDHTSNEGSD